MNGTGSTGFDNGRLQSLHIQGRPNFFFQGKRQVTPSIEDQNASQHPVGMDGLGTSITGMVRELFLQITALRRNQPGEQLEGTDRLSTHGAKDVPLFVHINGPPLKEIGIELQNTRIIATISLDNRQEGHFGVSCRELGQLLTVLAAADSPGLPNGKDHRDVGPLGLALGGDGLVQGYGFGVAFFDHVELTVQHPQGNRVDRRHLGVIDFGENLGLVPTAGRIGN